jgi:hypothetical protein
MRIGDGAMADGAARPLRGLQGRRRCVVLVERTFLNEKIRPTGGKTLLPLSRRPAIGPLLVRGSAASLTAMPDAAAPAAAFSSTATTNTYVNIAQLRFNAARGDKIAKEQLLALIKQHGARASASAMCPARAQRGTAGPNIDGGGL